MGTIFQKPLVRAQDTVRRRKLQFLESRDNFIEEMLISEDSKDGAEEIPSIKQRVKSKDKFLPRMPSVLTELEERVLAINPEDHIDQYPFENLVFEGGGSKGMAYCGVARVFEELGIIDKIKRYAGTSVGSVMATLLCVGYKSYEISEILGNDNVGVADASFGIFSLMPNLLNFYGWHPGKKFHNLMGDLLERKMGDRDITFIELYKKTGKELCLVVANLNNMTEEYCHPKTTPDLPIRLAVRMSIAIPGFLQPVKYTGHRETNYYVDGGCVCSYPIHCFDGWWLSLKPGDSFIERLHPLDNLPHLLDNRQRFYREPANVNKTLGFLLYAENEQDIFKFTLEKRIGSHIGDPPDTKLARMRIKQNEKKEKERREHRRIVAAVDDFLKILRKHNVDRNHVITKETLEKVFLDKEFSEKNCQRLFGQDCTAQKAFEVMDDDGNGEITFTELVNFIQGTGVSFQKRVFGYQRSDITGLSSFINALLFTYSLNAMKAFVVEDDIERTVGINTGYIGTHDFTLEKEDKEFLIELNGGFKFLLVEERTRLHGTREEIIGLPQQGYRSTVSFLKYYIAKREFED